MKELNFDDTGYSQCELEPEARTITDIEARQEDRQRSYDEQDLNAKTDTRANFVPTLSQGGKPK